MALSPVRQGAINAYLLMMLTRGLFGQHGTVQEVCQQFNIDVNALFTLHETRYLNGRDLHVPKAGNMHLAWAFKANPPLHGRFEQMLRISPNVFDTVLSLIEHHTVFQNNSNCPQTPVKVQLAVTLYRMGRYGNGASVQDIARAAGCSEGSVENYTHHCFNAIEDLQEFFIRNLTPEEKEREKEWIDEQLGFRGAWREGWVMYDGTIVVLHQRPSLNGDAYYTRKANYGLNIQIGNVPSNLRIVDFSHGHTGSCHDARAFEGTAAHKYPNWLFSGEEFAWMDSAYPCTPRSIPVHKEPLSLIPRNTIFDRYVSRLRVRSEHAMGALKGRFQCLRGLRIHINSKSDHVEACHWVTIAIILHNIVVELEDNKSVAAFAHVHTNVQEEEDRGPRQNPDANLPPNGEAKRQMLIDELMTYRLARDKLADED